LHLGGPANWSTTPVCYRHPNLLFLLNADNDCIDFFKILFKYTTFNAVINKLYCTSNEHIAESATNSLE
jgi:hypothetical protein